MFHVNTKFKGGYIMNSDKTSTIIILITTILWAVITFLGWTGHWLVGMFLGIPLMLSYMVLGSSKKGKFDKRILTYPMMPWVILWGISFYLSYYYGSIFAGKIPNFTILGFHPSFAWTILTYWIGGVITLTIGFIVNKDKWLSDIEWQEFKYKINEINTKEGGKA